MQAQLQEERSQREQIEASMSQMYLWMQNVGAQISIPPPQVQLYPAPRQHTPVSIYECFTLYVGNLILSHMCNILFFVQGLSAASNDPAANVSPGATVSPWGTWGSQPTPRGPPATVSPWGHWGSPSSQPSPPPGANPQDQDLSTLSPFNPWERRPH